MSELNSNNVQQINDEIDGKALQVLSISVDEEEKRKRVGAVFSFVWTIISIIFSIAMTAYMMSQHWVSETFTIVLAALLAFFIIVVLLLVGLFFTNADKIGSDKGLKIVGFLIRIFKAILNIVYVALTIIAIAGMAYNGMDTIKQWAVLLATLLVAVIKLILVIFNFFAPKIIKRRFSRGTYVKTTYVNGKKNKKKHVVWNKFLKKLSDWSSN